MEIQISQIVNNSIQIQSTNQMQ